MISMTDGGSKAPRIDYSPAQQRIIAHRGGHLQVVACAGSGKTETMAARVASMLADGTPPAGIIAFTFTNAAAAALKHRILLRAHDRMPHLDVDALSPMYIGTIHAFCLRFLQRRVPRYASFELFEDHRLVALLNRHYYDLGLDGLGIRWITEAIERFLLSADVVENELMTVGRLPKSEFRHIYRRYLALLDRHRVLTHNHCITRAVERLTKLGVLRSAFPDLRVVIVDEYQDINPAQAMLIRALAARPAAVSVVGDDDQAIYQWRGSSVEYVRQFRRAFHARVERLDENRRCRPAIVEFAKRFARSIPDRLTKRIVAVRPPNDGAVTVFAANRAEDEAGLVADAIATLHHNGTPYGAIAILLRSAKLSAQPFLVELDRRKIPYNCIGRLGLFVQQEIELLGRVFAFLGGRDTYYISDEYTSVPADLGSLVATGRKLFRLTPASAKRLRGYLQRWREDIIVNDPINAVGRYYGLLRLVGASRWKLDEAKIVGRLGALARFSALLVDFESVVRREREGERGGIGQRGGMRQDTFYKRLAAYIGFYAQTKYEDFRGEPDFALDAVTVSTVHGAKGLEWPVVFVPCLSAKRFPPTRTGQPRPWLIPRHRFPAERYEGSDADERRLLYVALTRAREYLYVSGYWRKSKNFTGLSPFFKDLARDWPEAMTTPLPVPAAVELHAPNDDERPTLTFADVACYAVCPLSYRYRVNLGFEAPRAQELGYGRSIHQILRRLSELVQAKGELPRPREVERVFNDEFYLPYADRAAFAAMRDRAQRLVDRYLADFSDELRKTWDVGRPFELHLPEGNLIGRADVVWRQNAAGCAVVRYETRVLPHSERLHRLELAAYAAAARGEGVDVREAYVHDLSADAAEARTVIATDADATGRALDELRGLVTGIRERRFAAEPGPHCRECDVRLVCQHGRVRPHERAWQGATA